MTKHRIFNELRDIAHDLITEGGRLMNARQASVRQLAEGRLLIDGGAGIQIVRAELFKVIANKRYRRLTKRRGRK